MTPRARLVAIIGTAAALTAISFIKPQEGTVDHTYRDVVGVLTSCTGHTGPELRMGQTFTPEECNEQLAGDLIVAAQGVVKCTHVPLSPNERAAYVSFTFNVGVTAYCNSTLVQMLNVGNHRGACDQLLRWNRAGGQVFPGLTNRRAAERTLCLKDPE